jgi:hypothetical protein
VRRTSACLPARAFAQLGAPPRRRGAVRGPEVDDLGNLPLHAPHMRVRSAPEARGIRHTWFYRVAGGTPALGALAFAGPLPGPARAESEAPAAGRLQAIAPSRKPGITLPETAGGSLAPADLRGRVAPVHFFATCSEPCRAELASLTRRAQSGAQNRPITVVAYDVAEVPARLRLWPGARSGLETAAGERNDHDHAEH